MLFVAHDEERAGFLMAALAGKEVLRHRLDDLPLQRARILCLVHQYVGNPVIELVAHPRADAVTAKKVVGPRNQVVEVEPSPAVLQMAVFGQHRLDNDEQRLARLQHFQRAQTMILLHHQQTFLCQQFGL